MGVKAKTKGYITVFIAIDGLPTKDGEYFTDQGCITFSNGRFYAFSPEWWLKEIDLSELMVSTIKLYNRKYCIHSDTGQVEAFVKRYRTKTKQLWQQ